MLPDVRLNGPIPAIAHLDQYGGVWSINERHARQLIARVNQLNLSVHVAAHQDDVAAAAKAVNIQTVDTSDQRKLAIVRLEGVMTKYGGSMASQGSTLRARRELRQAAKDPQISGILLEIDSPGGSVSGTPDLARDVAEIAKSKPVFAYCEDCCCSAAYYVASQATRVFANANAVVGSIGVYMVVDDFSKLYEEQGVKAHLIKFGQHKGAGVEGTEVTDEQLEHWQEEVNVLGEQFVAAVQKGRGLTKAAAKQLADGRVHIGQAAVDIGLVDGVQSLDKTLADLAKAKPGGKTKAAADAGEDPLYVAIDGAASGETRVESDPTPTAVLSNESPTTLNSEEDEMSKQTAADAATTKPADAPQAATYTAIAAACKGFNEDSGDDAKFAASCLKRNLTLEQAREEWMDTLAARIEARDQEIAKSQEAIIKSAAPLKPAGNPPLNDGNDGAGKVAATAGDPIANWNALIADYEQQGYPKAIAVRMAACDNQELHQAYLAAYKEEAAKGRRPGARR